VARQRVAVVSAPEDKGIVTKPEVVERVQQWLANDAAGWTTDTPDLDLERYWESGGGLVIYPDLDPLVGKVTRASFDRTTLMVKTGPPLKGKK
jgi:hypothetical protein